MPTTSTTVRVLSGFEDPSVTPAAWDALLRDSKTDIVFLTRPWQEAWWEAFGRGQQLLIAAECDRRLVTLAPLFSDGGMIFFIGSGGSDYLDFLGETDPGILSQVLRIATGCVPDFVGFRFYHVPDDSSTGAALRQAAADLGMECFDEGSLPAPAMDMAGTPNAALEASRKKSLVRHERYFAAEGRLAVHHWTDAAAITPQLPEFFRQHAARWAVTPYPSLFQDPAQRSFYERLVQAAGPAGWLRFTRLDWDARPIAFHLGFCYRGSYLWYKPSFEIELARRSPGEVLLRQLLLAAIEENAEAFDFGLGDEPFKRRFANRVRHVRTWGLYPPATAPGHGDHA